MDRLKNFNKKLQDINYVNKIIRNEPKKFLVYTNSTIFIEPGNSKKINVSSELFLQISDGVWWFDGYSKKWPEICAHNGIIGKDRKIEMTNFGDEAFRIDKDSIIGEAWETSRVEHDVLEFEDLAINVLQTKKNLTRDEHLKFEEILMGVPDELRNIMMNNKEIFRKESNGEGFKFINVQEVVLPVKSDCPSEVKPAYRKKLKVSEEDDINVFIEEHLNSGLIERIEYSSFTSPIVLVKKRSGATRVCVDLRKINQKCIQKVSSIPDDIPDTVNKLGGMKVFSSFDIKSAYHRIKVHKDYRKFTGFEVTSGLYKGNYRFLSLAQGLVCSPVIFSNIMREILRPLQASTKVYVYCDDLIIASKNTSEHVMDIKRVLNRLREFNVTLDLEKTELLKKEICWCGMKFENGSISVDPSRYDRMKTLIIPDLKKEKTNEWLSIFGFYQYFRRFIKNLSKKRAEIRELAKEVKEDHTKESTNLRKIQDILDSFNESIKQSELHLPERDDELQICSDASNYAVGYIVKNQANKIVEFGGRQLRGPEVNYSTFEKELVGILAALKNCQSMILITKKTTLFSDNIASILCATGSVNIITARAVRMILKIQQICQDKVIFKHIKGIQNTVADSLSRMMFEDEFEHKTIINMLVAQNEKLRDEWSFSRTNNNNKLLIYKEIKDDTETTFGKDEEQSFEDGIYQDIWTIHNKTHCGLEKMKKTADKYDLHHENRTKMIKDIIHNCNVCQNEVKVMSKTYVGKTQTPSYEMKSISIDHMHVPISDNDNRYIFSLMDRFSKYTILIPVPTKDMHTSLERLKSIVNIFPTISEIHFDNAFNTVKVKEWAANRGINVHCTASHGSYGNEVERVHSTVRKLIKQFTDRPDCEEWEEVIHKVMDAINGSVHLATNEIPFEMVFNKRWNLINNELEEIGPDLGSRRKSVFKNIEEKKLKRVKTTKIHDVEIGEPVVVKFSGLDKSRKPARIIEDLGASVMVEYNNGTRFKISKRDLIKQLDRIDIHDPELT